MRINWKKIKEHALKPYFNENDREANEGFALTRRRFLAAGFAGSVGALGVTSFHIGMSAGEGYNDRTMLEEFLKAENPHIDSEILRKIALDFDDLDAEIGAVVAALSASVGHHFYASDYYKKALEDKQYQVGLGPFMGNALFLGLVPWAIVDEKLPIHEEEKFMDAYELTYLQATGVRKSLKNYRDQKFRELYFIAPTAVTAIVSPKAEKAMKHYHQDKMRKESPWDQSP
ncbi:MAG: hypothetical protein ACLFR0_08480 [Alphaproteobacteria bacterium]